MNNSEIKHKVINHWGVWIDSESPITGVISNNAITQFIYDEWFDSIDLTFEEFEAHIREEYGEDSEEYQNEIENYYSDGDDTHLIGEWIKDNDGLYTHDPEGEYAAIVRYDVTQVVWSRYTIRARLCSPCYPGQADVEQYPNGDYLAYTLPKEAFEY